MIEYIDKLVKRQDLVDGEAEAAMKAIMSGQATEAQTAAFLTALRMKGETAGEIAAFARVMRENATKISPKVKGTLVDVCGTGGDGSGTFNISTSAMFVVAAAGVPVAKHGNRSYTSKCGSADVLEALGARIDLPPERICSCIEEVGVGFMFAPMHHPSMKNVMPVRKQLGIRTVFNILGPLTNPAGAQAQVMGVFDPAMTEMIADVFRILGLKRAFVVNGYPGLDELSTLGTTKVSELASGKVRTYLLEPAELGLAGGTLDDLKGGSPNENAGIIRGIFTGKAVGPRRDIVLLNAAAGLIAGGVAGDFKSALAVAEKVLAGGHASSKLEEFVEYTRSAT